MKKTFNYLMTLTLAASVFVFTSCDDAVEDIFKPTDSTTVDISAVATATIGTDSSLANLGSKTSVKALVKFSSPSKDMDRMYVTRNLNGEGVKPFELSSLLSAADKATIKDLSKPDGSIDLEGDTRKGLSFVFDLPVPSDLSGEAVYTFWATSGKGDFRDPTKRQVIKPTTITLRKGDNPDAPLLFDDIEKTLEAPLADKSSKTFVSTFDCSIQTLGKGAEFAAFWDFGFYYGGTGLTSLASTADYPALFLPDGASEKVAIAELTGVPQEDLNKCYFEKTELTKAQFEATKTVAQIKALNLTVSATSSQRVNQIEDGSVIAFLNAYGKTGLIYVISSVNSTGTDGSITFDIKVMP